MWLKHILLSMVVDKQLNPMSTQHLMHDHVYTLIHVALMATTIVVVILLVNSTRYFTFGVFVLDPTIRSNETYC